ncbi:hypothetical protein ABTO42_19430, partial [Acinetobacter baumannii]
MCRFLVVIALVAGAGFFFGASSQQEKSPGIEKPLKDLAFKAGIEVGTAVSSKPLLSDESYRQK